MYYDLDSFSEINREEVKGVHAYCFHGDKLVIVYSEIKGYWTPPGGGVEPNETIENALIREVLEETNMRVLNQKIIGALKIFEPNGIVTQVRAMCIVEPIGPFVRDADPEGDVTEIKLIDSKDIKQYFDWGRVGDHILARALQIKTLVK